MKSVLRKITLPLITIGLVLGLSYAVQASGSFTTTAGVHVRSSASAASTSLTSVSRGTSVSVLEHDPAGWSKVQAGGVTGYIRSDFLKATGDSVTFSTTSGVHVRESASTSAKSLTVLSRGASVSVLEHDPAGWSKVQSGNITGYIRSDFLRHSGAASAPPSENAQSDNGAATAGTDDPGTVTENRQVTGNVNMRSGASTSSGIIRTLPRGTTVGILEHEANGWSRVLHNGTAGYIRSDLLAPAASSSEQSAAQTLYTTGNVNLRSSASTSSSIIRTLTRGTAVSVIDQANGWSQVTHNGSTGHIRSDLLTPSAQGESQTRYTSGNVNMRSSASTSSSIIRTLSNGTAVTVLADESNGWSRVSHNNTVGFIRTDLLTTSSSGGNQVIALMRVASRDGANMRAGPGTSFERVRSALPYGTEVSVLANESNGWSKVRVNNNVGYIKSDLLSTSVGASVELVTMAEINHLLPVRQPIRVVDVRTGISYNITIFSKSASRHADYEPSTRADTETMFAIRNGARSWSARPLWVYVGNRIFAAATHSMPHDVNWIADNGMNGHLCLHFHNTVANSATYQADLRRSVQEAYDKRPR